MRTDKEAMVAETISISHALQEALAETVQGLERLYGNRLVKVVLFGSYARGNAHAESDVDLLVVLRDEFRLYDEIKRTSGLVMDILIKHQLPLSLLHFPEHRYQDPFHPLMMNVNEEGIVL